MVEVKQDGVREVAMRVSRQWWIWLAIPVLYLGVRMLEGGSCASPEVQVLDVMNEQITRAGLTEVTLNTSKNQNRGYFVASRGEARCWGHLELEEGAREAQSLDYLCTNDQLADALTLPPGADSRSHQRAESCGDGNMDDCVGLGLSFMKAQNGLKMNPGAFMRLFYEACEGKNANGCWQLALQYTTPTLIPQDVSRALNRYTEGCELGLLTSCQDGLTLGIRSGESVQSKSLRAHAVAACQHRVLDGCNTLGVMQIHGQGGPLEREQGIEVLKRACDQGFVASCENLETEGNR